MKKDQRKQQANEKTTVFEGYTTTEKRRSPRVNVSIAVTFKTVDDFITEFARDLSEQGMYIATNEPHSLFTEIDMEFQPPTSPNEIITIKGQVERIHKPEDCQPDGPIPGMFVQFIDITPETQRKIKEIIRELVDKK
jgi:hypothetical protein